MNRVDPRTSYDDLYVSENVHEVEPDRYADLVTAEPFDMGWVTIATVVDDDGRVLLIYDEADECWVVPGGTVKPSETLTEAVVREVDEEAGVEIVPERPHSVVEVGCTDGERSAGFNVVGYEATPVTTTVGTDLGVDDESITDAAWFSDLPENLFEREHAEVLVERARENRV
ncbi:MAG: NUDIX hydrolase [Halolamina sp.]